MNPNHSGGLQQLARVLVDSVKARTAKMDKISQIDNNNANKTEKAGSRDSAQGDSTRPSLHAAMDCYEKAIALVKDVSDHYL